MPIAAASESSLRSEYGKGEFSGAIGENILRNGEGAAAAVIGLRAHSLA